MPEEDNFTPPTDAGAGDHAHMVARISLGAVPIVGGAAVELFNQVVLPPLQARKDAWCEKVGERLNTLGSIEALQSNEAFVSAVVQASRIAIGEHQEEKLDALQNAVLNAAGPAPIEESRQQMFIQLIERLTVWHLRLLKLVMSPVAWFRDAGRPAPQYAITSSILRLVGDAYPELNQDRDFIELVFGDLKTAGLCSVSNVAVNMSATGALENRGTTLGAQFLAFISEPRQP